MQTTWVPSLERQESGNAGLTVYKRALEHPTSMHQDRPYLPLSQHALQIMSPGFIAMRWATLPAASRLHLLGSEHPQVPWGSSDSADLVTHKPTQGFTQVLRFHCLYVLETEFGISGELGNMLCEGLTPQLCNK